MRSSLFSAWRAWLVCVAVLLLLSSGPVSAQPVAAGAPATASPPAVSAAELERLVKTIEDPAQRERLVGDLKALIAVERRQAPPETETIGARFLSFLSQHLAGLGGGLYSVAAALTELPRVAEWLVEVLGNAADRERLALLAAHLVLIVGLGHLASWLVRRLLAPARRHLRRAETSSLWTLPLHILARAGLGFLPIGTFALTAYSLLALSDPAFMVRLIALFLINASLIARAILMAGRLLLAPDTPRLRLFALSDESVAYGYLWLKRVVNLSVYGYFAAEAALLLGLPYGPYVLVLRLLGVVIAAELTMIVLQSRGGVAAAIRASAAGNRLSGLRYRLADLWHLFAFAYIGVSLAVWLLRPDGGFAFILHGTWLTALIALLTRLALWLVQRLIDYAFSVAEDLRERFPGLEARANRYLAVLHTSVQALILAVAAFAALQAWGLDSLSWLVAGGGQRITLAVITIALIVVGAVLVWEAINVALERHLTRYAADAGDQLRQAARMRTLVPLLQKLVLGTLVIVVILLSLGELGLNITPLLAGAGVVGIALGLGAQSLIKDLIGGASILIEDSLAVGDIVKIGQNSGTVEWLSLRAVRLRGVDGTLHTIPYSEFQTVSNMSKDFAFAVFDVSVAYRTDLDRAMEVMKATGAETRQDPVLGPIILEDLDIWGVERLEDSGVIIRARFRTLPGKQWTVMRGFNRRLKLAFDAAGIEIPFPQRTVHLSAHPSALPVAPGATPPSPTEAPASAAPASG